MVESAEGSNAKESEMIVYPSSEGQIDHSVRVHAIRIARRRLIIFNLKSIDKI